jgi:hypothetical protein
VTRQKTLRRKSAFKTGPIWVRFAKKRRELPGKGQSIFTVIRHIPPTRQNTTRLRRGGLPGDNPLWLAPQLPGMGPKTRNPPRCTPATFVGSRGPKRRGSTSRPVFTSHLPGKTTENAGSPDARQLPGRAQLTYPAKRIPPTRQMTRASHPPEASGPLHGQSAHLTYPARTPRPPHRPKAVCPPASHEGCQPTPDLSSTSPSASSQSSYPANPGAETIGTPFNTRD